MTNETARSLTLLALIETEKEQKYSGPVLETMRRRSSLSKQDKELFAFLYRGVLERKISLDARLAPYLNPDNPPQSEAMWLLRLGLFQLVYADGIKPYAAVNETVQAAKAAGYPQLAGLCNGVMRAWLRDDGKKFVLPEDPTARISAEYAVEPSLVRLLLSQYDEKTLTDYLARSFEPKRIAFRVNPLKTTEQELFQKLKAKGITVFDSPVPLCFFVNHSAELLSDPMMREGLYYVQDPAAQAAALALGAQKGDTVYDPCAAPGTKSFTLAGLLENEGKILAGDLYLSRIKKIREGAGRLGITCIRTHCGDASRRNRSLVQTADRLLLDVPCSGLGTLSGKPEIRWKTAGQISELPKIQRKILFSSAEYVKINGILVYSTCTVNREENEAVTEAFLAERPDFERDPLPSVLSFLPEKRPGEALIMNGDLQSDGFYICRMRRKAASN